MAVQPWPRVARARCTFMVISFRCPRPRWMTPESTTPARPRDRLEDHLVTADLDEHERPVISEAGRGQRRRRDAALPKLPARALDEVGDALLGCRAFVDMLVSGEDHVHVVSQEERFQDDAQLHVRAVAIAI